MSIDTWRMWRAAMELSPGSHRLQVRAGDRSGCPQVAPRTPAIPDGVTGWHTVDIAAA